MTETQERFLHAIAARVPLERVAELYLFAALRQGQLESGVAVVAVEMDAPASVAATEFACCVLRESSAVILCASEGSAVAVPPSARADPPLGLEITAPDSSNSQHAPDAEPSRPREAPTLHGPPLAPARLTIYSAHYRLTIKGRDRGKWEISVSAEADAPLVTVEAVVRGVRHRAGDGADTERLSGEELRAMLAATAHAWTAAK